MKHTLLFATIASFVVVHAYANNIVTSKTYVDGRDALKVDIAQGAGDNNANVGKTLVVNSSGNLELGTPAAGNYVEDAITDGVTDKAPSENAVNDALANKQDAIETDTVTFTNAEDEVDYEVPSLVAFFDSTNGINGTQIGLVDLDNGGDGLTFLASEIDPWNSNNGVYDNYVPTYRTVAAGLSDIYFEIDDLRARMPDITPITWVPKDTTAVNSYSTTFGGSGRSAWPAEHENQYVTGASLAQGLALKQIKLAANNSTNNPNGSLVTYGTIAGQPGSKKIVTTVREGGTYIPTDGAVYTAVNAKQDKIPARATKIESTDSTYAPSVVTNTTTNGSVGQMAILTAERVSNDDAEFADYTNADSLIPTVAAVASAIGDKQDKITTAEVRYKSYMLPSIVSFDSTHGLTGDIYGILDDGTIASHVGHNIGAAWFAASALNSLNMIPTAAAVARAIVPINFNSAAVTNYSTTFDGTVGNWQNNGENLLVSGSTFVGGLALKQNRQIGAAPGGNANSTDAGKVLVVGNDGNIAMGSAPDSAPTNSSTNLVTSGGVYTAVNAKQAKKVCAGWPDGAEHTDANCWLWNMPD